MNSMMLTSGPILRPESQPRRGLAVALDARAAGRSDNGRVDWSRGQHHAVAGVQLEALALALERESDRPVDAVQHFFVRVRVRRVAVARSVRPRVATTRLALELRHQVLERVHEPILRLLR